MLSKKFKTSNHQSNNRSIHNNADTNIDFQFKSDVNIKLKDFIKQTIEAKAPCSKIETEEEQCLIQSKPNIINLSLLSQSKNTIYIEIIEDDIQSHKEEESNESTSKVKSIFKRIKKNKKKDEENNKM